MSYFLLLKYKRSTGVTTLKLQKDFDKDNKNFKGRDREYEKADVRT